MKHFRIVLLSVTLLSAMFFTNCKGGAEEEKNPLADSLKNVNNQLSSQVNEKEEALQEFIASFNEIQENLNVIKEKEKIVTSVSTTKGDVKNKQNQIREDIQSIYDLMEKNKNRISSLSAKLKSSNLKISGMQKMIENLQASLNLKDEEISELRTRIESLNIELSTLGTNYRAVEKENAEKTEALNTAYYAIGTSKELKEKKVIAKEGGFIGIGKSTVLPENFNREYFTKVNIQQTTNISLGAKKVKLLTNHPKDSYKLVGEKPVEKLEITNVKDFWSSSKYLVIMIE